MRLGQIEVQTGDIEMSTQAQALDRAIADAGGILAFSQAMGISHQAVYSWKRRGYVPIERALLIEDALGVPARDLVKPSLARVVDNDGGAAGLI
jgi:hypothetical protein